MSMPPEPGGLTPEIEEAVHVLEGFARAMEAEPNPEIREQGFALLASVDLLHRRGVQVLLRHLRADPAPAARGILDDPAVALLAEIYEPDDPDEREPVYAALEEIRPVAEAHAGPIEVLAVRDGVVTVRLAGVCKQCQGSSADLRRLIERTLRDRLPGFLRLEVIEPGGGHTHAPAPARGTFIPLSALLGSPEASGPRWHPVGDLDTIPYNGLRVVDLAGEPVLLARLDNTVYAYRNLCAASPMPLAVEGQYIGLQDAVLLCHWHGCRYDLRTGARVDRKDAPALTPVPVLVDGEEVRLGTGAGSPVAR
jgi:nitrite reductase/ring-hydroxylating ferredoxin subunit/Fe-S cluster biogenesis protein NfuA